MSIDFAAGLRDLAEPAPRGDRVKSAIQRAAKAAGLTYTRAFDIWYGKARRIEADEAQRITQALQKKSEEEARNEFYDLRSRLLRLESILVSTDPDFHREDIDLARRHLRQVGGTNGGADRALASGLKGRRS